MLKINWWFIGAVLFCASVWAAIGWALYNWFHAVQ